MRSAVINARWLLCGLAGFALFAATSLAASDTASKPPEPSDNEKTRKAMDALVSLEVSDQALSAALQDLSDKTKIKFVLDKSPLTDALDLDSPVSVKVEKVPVRTALRKLLAEQGLGYVILDDMVLVTSEENASYRQVRQPVSLELDKVPFDAALKRLAKETCVNVVLDPRVPKEARTAALTIQLEDSPLENAVRLLAELADLKSVRVGNTLFVTTETRAVKMKRDKESTPPANPDDIIGLPRARPKMVPAPVPVPVPDTNDDPDEKKPEQKKEDK